MCGMRHKTALNKSPEHDHAHDNTRQLKQGNDSGAPGQTGTCPALQQHIIYSTTIVLLLTVANSSGNMMLCCVVHVHHQQRQHLQGSMARNSVCLIGRLNMGKVNLTAASCSSWLQHGSSSSRWHGSVRILL